MLMASIGMSASSSASSSGLNASDSARVRCRTPIRRLPLRIGKSAMSRSGVTTHPLRRRRGQLVFSIGETIIGRKWGRRLVGIYHLDDFRGLRDIETKPQRVVVDAKNGHRLNAVRSWRSRKRDRKGVGRNPHMVRSADRRSLVRPERLHRPTHAGRSGQAVDTQVVKRVSPDRRWAGQCDVGKQLADGKQQPESRHAEPKGPIKKSHNSTSKSRLAPGSMAI